MNARKGRSLEVPGVTHGNAPIPMGARVGNTLYSSGIMGKDPATDSFPPDVAAQARFAFDNMNALLEAGGSSVADVVRMTVYIKDESARAPLNEQWIKYFPDPHDRPARHVLKHDLASGMLIQLEIIAIVSES
jgi:2-iminobutanoate/2-iminopropanoate deaminase